MKKYKIRFKQNNEIKSIIVNFEEEILLNELPKNIIEIKEINNNFFDFFQFNRQKSLKQKDLMNIFYELNLMLNANISFSSSVDILLKNRKNKQIKDFLNSLKFAFSTTKEIDEVFEKFNIDEMILSFLKIIKRTGNIKENINSLYEILKEKQSIKKQFYKAISYPLVLLVSFFISFFSIFYFVVPKFELMFSENLENLNFSTISLLFLGRFVENYIIYIVFSAIFLFLFFLYLKKSSYDFSYFCDEIIVKKVYIIKDIYLSLQLYRMFLVINLMLKSKYEFHNALNNTKILIKNNYLLDKINFIENLLFNGEKISKAFLKSDLFDEIVLNLLSTGESSNCLYEITDEIKKIYKNRFDNSVYKLINLIQPIFLIFIMGMILWIVLAIFVPIWDMGNMIKI